MLGPYKAAGLAANQVGSSLRLLVTSTGLNLINPEIVSFSVETCDMQEGCLSLPGIECKITRPAGIEVSYDNLDGEHCNVLLEGLPARVVQHEIDHLDGIMFIDHISPMRRRLLLKNFWKQR